MKILLKQNILLLTSEFPPLPGGIGNHALNLALSLQNEGYTVKVITNLRDNHSSEENEFDKNLPFKVYRVKRYSIAFLTYLERITKTSKEISKSKCATIICSGKFSLWLGAFFSLFYPNQKYIGILHGSEIFAGNKLSKKFTAWTLTRLKILVAVSNFTKNLALAINPRLKIRVINNGYQLPQNIHTPIPSTVLKGEPSLVTVGKVSYRKGQHNVIKALSILSKKYPNIHYHLIGIPEEKINFEKLASNLGVTNCISFHGIIEDKEKLRVLSQSKIFMMLSDTLKNGDVEGFGIAILEANHFGVPAIGSIHTGIADAISDGYSGKLVHPKNPLEITKAIDEILENYDPYSKQAKKWSENFSWDIIIKQYLQIIACENL